VTSNGDGSFDYTPDPGFTGTDSFGYKICDTGTPALCDTATVNLTIATGTVTLSFAPRHDALVTSKSPLENFGTLTTLELRAQSNEIIHSYLKFEVTGLSGTVSSAKLRLYVDKDSTDGGSVYAVSNYFLDTTTPWQEADLRWDNAPGLAGAPLSSVAGATSGTWVEFDVTAAITGDGTYSFGLDTVSRNRVIYRSKEAVDSGPELVIEIQSTP
jgi:hypothetical protein